jgi:hypothetical protein
MSIELINARPQGIGWSAPIDRESTRALHGRYETHGGHIDRRTILLVLWNNKGFNRELREPMTDGYSPYVSVVFWVGMGKAAVVFPFCTEASSEGVCERRVSVHTAGEVSEEDLDRFILMLTESIQEKRPAPAVPIRDWLRPTVPGPKKPVSASNSGFAPWPGTDRGSII